MLARVSQGTYYSALVTKVGNVGIASGRNHPQYRAVPGVLEDVAGRLLTAPMFAINNRQAEEIALTQLRTVQSLRALLSTMTQPLPALRSS